MTPEEVQAALREPFASHEVGFKPQSIKGNRALAVAFIDARNVQDRLDAVVGLSNWQDDYDLMPDMSVVCRLRVRVGGEWVTKTDVGSPSDQPDSGDRLKAAFSDALKRAAVKFGIGRYLYSVEAEWCDYDPVKKKFVGTPSLPEWARPKASRPAPPRQQAAPVVPVWDDADAFFALLQRRGKAWMGVVGWLNEKHGGGYKADAGFFDVSEAHRRLAADAMGGR